MELEARVKLLEQQITLLKEAHDRLVKSINNYILAASNVHRPKSFDVESKDKSVIITDTLDEFAKLAAEDKYDQVFCKLTTNLDKVIISKLCNGHYVFDFALLYSFKSNGLIFGAYSDSANELGFEICNLATLEEALNEAK